MNVEYIFQWMGLAERYMKATRDIFEEMNVDFERALETVKEQDD